MAAAEEAGPVAPHEHAVHVAHPGDGLILDERWGVNLRFLVDAPGFSSCQSSWYNMVNSVVAW